jgi:hypothetical protein
VPERALEECLAALKGERNLQEVLRRYPRHRDELISLLQLSIDAARLPQPAPDPAFRLRARNQMLAAAEQSRRVRRWMPASVRVALAAALLLVALAGGLTAAASNSLPGEPLYGLKRGVEHVQMTATFNPADQARLRLHFADLRLEEAQKLAALGRVSDAVNAIGQYQLDVSHFDQSLALAALTSEEAGDIERLLGDRQVSSTQRLESLAGSLNAQGKLEAAAAVAHAESQVKQSLGSSKQRLEAQSGAPRSGRPAASPASNP